MSLTPFWMRYIKTALQRDPVFQMLQEPWGAFVKDPFFRSADKLLGEAPPHGIEGVYSAHEVRADGEKVELLLDVQNFSPDQIHVKTIGNEVLVEGRREVRRGDGWTRSHFERRFLLPAGFPPERVECHLDKDKLRLVAFRAQPLQERTVPINDASNPDIKDTN